MGSVDAPGWARQSCLPRRRTLRSGHGNAGDSGASKQATRAPFSQSVIGSGPGSVVAPSAMRRSADGRQRCPRRGGSEVDRRIGNPWRPPLRRSNRAPGRSPRSSAAPVGVPSPCPWARVRQRRAGETRQQPSADLPGCRQDASTCAEGCAESWTDASGQLRADAGGHPTPPSAGPSALPRADARRRRTRVQSLLLRGSPKARGPACPQCRRRSGRRVRPGATAAHASMRA